MPVIDLKSGLFDAVETMLDLPQTSLDYQTELDGLSMVSVGDPVVLQMSASLIRISQVLEVWEGGNPVNIPYELRVSGVGIKPVKTLDGLWAAINNGLATGELNQVQILRDGAAVLDLTLDAGGYVLSSGAQSVHLNGQLPLTFTQFYDLGGLLVDLTGIQYLTNVTRNELFTKLGSYGVTGLSVMNGADTMFGFQLLADRASLTLNGVTVALDGTFPGDLGEEVKLLWQMWRQLAKTGMIDVTLLDNFDVTALSVTGPAGQVLASMANPLDGTSPVWRMDGRTMDEVVVGNLWDDRINGAAGAVASAVAGLGGNDWLNGGSSRDMLFGGTGGDRLFGGLGADRLNGGAGRDVLNGGAQADVFVFTAGAGVDTIADFQAGVDRIEIRAANSLADLTFTDIGSGVRIDFRAMQLTVLNIEVDQLRVTDSFVF